MSAEINATQTLQSKIRKIWCNDNPCANCPTLSFPSAVCSLMRSHSCTIVRPFVSEVNSSPVPPWLPVLPSISESWRASLATVPRLETRAIRIVPVEKYGYRALGDKVPVLFDAVANSNGDAIVSFLLVDEVALLSIKDGITASANDTFFELIPRSSYVFRWNPEFLGQDLNVITWTARHEKLVDVFQA
jgi:hypothetical protein